MLDFIGESRSLCFLLVFLVILCFFYFLILLRVELGIVESKDMELEVVEQEVDISLKR